IRPGDTVAVDQLVAADVHWVRLGFHSGEDGISLPEYDRMIDTLCAHGIGILGLLNHETLTRQDYRAGDESELTSYRAEFAGVAEFLAAYYAQRVQFWEVWNEPNLVEGAYLPPADYAQLLQRTYQGIKRANPGAEVLLGGLASAWSDSYDYLSAIYAELDNNLQGARPFDHLALHPYPRKTEGPDPAVYMFADRPAGYNTIIDKFLQVMAEHGDGDKSIWVTEIGWNSALDSPNRPLCFAPVLVPEAEQGRYLKSMFDILFNEVSYWGRPGERAVAKVFWYQYMDVGTLDPCDMTPQPKDWWFGLYRGDKVTPKRSWCAFAAYPQSCAEPESAQ
ncbi:MAG TPA: glycosyl hydrolase, partial [Caldilineaceae bacterium]|nr:glycosyl hydrolase [Caldilineaceae bacterium]